jgi:hypothetical protein
MKLNQGGLRPSGRAGLGIRSPVINIAKDNVRTHQRIPVRATTFQPSLLAFSIFHPFKKLKVFF